MSSMIQSHLQDGSKFEPIVPWVHTDVVCDGCQKSPISGHRYVSQTRSNFDLCSACLRRQEPASQREFARIERTQSSLPFQIEYMDCKACGVAPIKGVRYHHITRANYDLCSACFKGNQTLDLSNFDRVQDGQTGKKHMPPFHFDVKCDECFASPIIGPRYTSLRNPNHDLCAFCHDKMLTNGSTKNGDFIVTLRPDPRSVYHLRLLSCLKCGALPICGPAYQHLRKESKTICLICYLAVKQEKQCCYKRKDPPISYSEVPKLNSPPPTSQSVVHKVPHHVSRSNFAPVQKDSSAVPLHGQELKQRSSSFSTEPAYEPRNHNFHNQGTEPLYKPRLQKSEGPNPSGQTITQPSGTQASRSGGNHSNSFPRTPPGHTQPSVTQPSHPGGSHSNSLPRAPTGNKQPSVTPTSRLGGSHPNSFPRTPPGNTQPSAAPTSRPDGSHPNSFSRAPPGNNHSTSHSGFRPAGPGPPGSEGSPGQKPSHGFKGQVNHGVPYSGPAPPPQEKNYGYSQPPPAYPPGPQHPPAYPPGPQHPPPYPPGPQHPPPYPPGPQHPPPYPPGPQHPPPYPPGPVAPLDYPQHSSLSTTAANQPPTSYPYGTSPTYGNDSRGFPAAPAAAGPNHGVALNAAQQAELYWLNILRQQSAEVQKQCMTSIFRGKNQDVMQNYLKILQHNSGGGGGNADFSSLLGGGGGGNVDFSSLLGGGGNVDFSSLLGGGGNVDFSSLLGGGLDPSSMMGGLGGLGSLMGVFGGLGF